MAFWLAPGGATETPSSPATIDRTLIERGISGPGGVVLVFGGRILCVDR